MAEAVDRLMSAGLLAQVLAVHAIDVGGVETAVVMVSQTAPGATPRMVDQALAGVPHECLISDRPARGTVFGLTGTKDGQTWQIGTQIDVSWINEGSESGLTIRSAIPAVYDGYATILIPEDDAARQAGETLLLHLLGQWTSPQPWWLGYLDTGTHDVVFDRAPKVVIYSGWSYVLVQAGPKQASSWRADDPWRGRLPDLIFPADHSWLVSMLWDDDWRCLGGPANLIRTVLAENSLDARAVGIDGDATPPGRTAI